MNVDGFRGEFIVCVTCGNTKSIAHTFHLYMGRCQRNSLFVRVLPQLFQWQLIRKSLWRRGESVSDWEKKITRKTHELNDVCEWMSCANDEKLHHTNNREIIPCLHSACFELISIWFITIQFVSFCNWNRKHEKLLCSRQTVEEDMNIHRMDI